MKVIHTVCMAFFGALLVVPAFAGSSAGDDSARYYKSNPDKYDGKKVDVDVNFVTRINGKDAVEGVTFFVAHTVDDENHMPGGSMIIALLDDDVDSFMRKYGTAPDRKGKGMDSRRLRADFHQLKGGRVYMDESGQAHALIEKHIEEKGPDGIPLCSDYDGGGSGGGWKHGKKEF